MRVLQLISSAGQYGAETVLVNLAGKLQAAGCPNVVAVFHNLHRPNTEIAQHARRQGLPVEIIECRGRLHRDAVKAIRQHLQKHRIDVLHTHGYKADIYGYLAAGALKIPVVATCHNWPGQTLVLRAYAVLDRWFLRRFAAVVAVSEGVRGLLRNAGVSAERIRIIGNGVDVARFRKAEPTLRRIADGKKVIGAIGRLEPMKGVQYLLRAFVPVAYEFADAVLVFVGAGPLRQALEDEARSLGVERSVVFAGERQDMPGVYASMDIFVLPSLVEGMPMVVLEALATGKAVIATQIGAVPEVIANHETGLLVQPADVDGLSKAMIKLLRDPALASRLAQAGHERVARFFSADSMAEHYQELYRSVAKAQAVEAPVHTVTSNASSR